MSYSPSSDGLPDLFDLKKFKELLRGPMGLEGRSPMHVSMSEPKESETEIGDLWYKPTKTPRVYVLTASGWEEMLKQGPIGLEGERGPKGEKGDPSSVPGPKGKDGKDGKDAVIDYEKVEKTAAFPVKEHEKKYDHSLIDPFLIGTKEINESAIDDGKVLQYDKKTDKIVYRDVKSVTNVIHQGGGGGVSKAFKTIAVSGQSNVVADSATDTLTLIAGSNITLTTNATNDSITITGSGGGSGITRSVNSISTPTTAGATASTDYVYNVTAATTLTLPAASGNTNAYTVTNLSAGTVTVATTGGDTIIGSATASLPLQYESKTFISDGSSMWTVV